MAQPGLGHPTPQPHEAVGLSPPVLGTVTSHDGDREAPAKGTGVTGGCRAVAPPERDRDGDALHPPPNATLSPLSHHRDAGASPEVAATGHSHPARPRRSPRPTAKVRTPARGAGGRRVTATPPPPPPAPPGQRGSPRSSFPSGVRRGHVPFPWAGGLQVPRDPTHPRGWRGRGSPEGPPSPRRRQHPPHRPPPLRGARSATVPAAGAQRRAGSGAGCGARRSGAPRGRCRGRCGAAGPLRHIRRGWGRGWRRRGWAPPARSRGRRRGGGSARRDLWPPRTERPGPGCGRRWAGAGAAPPRPRGGHRGAPSPAPGGGPAAPPHKVTPALRQSRPPSPACPRPLRVSLSPPGDVAGRGAAPTGAPTPYRGGSGGGGGGSVGVTPGKWGLGGIPLPAGAAPPARCVTSQSGAGVTPGGGPRMTSPAGGLSRGRGSFRRQDVAGPARMLQPRLAGGVPPSPGAHAGGWAHPTRDFIWGRNAAAVSPTAPPTRGTGRGDTTLPHAFFVWLGLLVGFFFFFGESCSVPNSAAVKGRTHAWGTALSQGGG